MTETNIRIRFSETTFELVHAHGSRRPIFSRRVRTGGVATAYNFIDLAVVPAGAEIARHAHALDNEEIYVVVDGTGEMECNGRAFSVAPGDVVINPPGGTHSLRNTGATQLRLVVVELKHLPATGRTAGEG